MSDEKKNNLSQWLGENQMEEGSGFSKEKTPLEIVEKALREDLGIENMSVDPVGGFIRFGISAKSTDHEVRVMIRGKSRLMTGQVYFRFKAEETKVEQLMLLAAYRNRNFTFGCDNVYDGAYAHEIYYFIPEDGQDRGLIAHLFSGAIRSADEAYPLAMGVLHGGKTPKSALDEFHQALEARKSEKSETNE
jgi:hypothetical protein